MCSSDLSSLAQVLKKGLEARVIEVDNLIVENAVTTTQVLTKVQALKIRNSHAASGTGLTEEMKLELTGALVQVDLLEEEAEELRGLRKEALATARPSK